MQEPARAIDAQQAAAGARVVERHRGFARRTLLISSLTLSSRVLGYAREMLSASLFGDSSGLFDAFITAWRVPNLFRSFLGEGALSTSLQTVLTEVDAKQGDAAGARVLRSTLRTVLALTLALCALVMAIVILMPDHMPITGFAWLGEDPGPVRELTARLMPYVVFVCLAAVAGGALQVRGHFALPAFAPVTLNVVWISALIAIGAHYGNVEQAGPEGTMEMVRWLAWAVLLSGAMQVCALFPVLRHKGLVATGPAPNAEAREQSRHDAWRVLKRAAPLALGAAVYQINVMVDGLMAESLLPNGAPTLHYYANRVQQFPMALVSIAATSAVFPALAALGQQGRRGELRALHDRTQRAILFVALPASVGLFVLATPIIAASFEHGAFGPEGVRRTANALRMLALAILPAGAVGLVARTYYAAGDFRTPVRASSVMLGSNVVLNLVFVRGFGMDVDGLALATSITSAAQLAWLLPGLSRKLGLPSALPGFGRDALRMVAASAACGAVAWSVQHLAAGHVGRGLALISAMGAGVLAFVVASAGLRVPELRSAWDRIRDVRPRIGR